MEPSHAYRPAAGPSSRMSFSWALVGLLAVGVALRFYRLGAQSLWTDEFLSLVDTTVIYHHESFWGSLVHNLHGPLFSLALYAGWQTAGLNEFWLRFPSAVAGCLALWAIYRLASDLYDSHTGWWALLLLALSPFHIWYSQEARNYSFLILFSILSTRYLHRFLSTGRRRAWIHYTWTALAALLSNLSAVFLIAAQAAASLVAVGNRPRRLTWLVLAGLVVLGALSPWLVEFNHRLDPGRLLSPAPVDAAERLRGDTTFTAWGIPFTFFVFSLGYSAGPSLRELHFQHPWNAVGQEAGVVLLGGLVFAGVFALGIWKTRDDRRTLAVLLLYLVVPILILSLLSARNIKVFNPRYLVVAFPAYILLLARGLSQVGRPWLRSINLGMVLLLSLYSLSNYYFDPRYQKEDLRDAARYVSRGAGPDDVILTTNCRSLFDLYYVGAPVVEGLPPAPRGMAADLERAVARIGEGHSRLWLVQVREWEYDPEGAAEKALQSKFGLLDEQDFPGVRVGLYDLRPGRGSAP
jgi:mannosyltransferase